MPCRSRLGIFAVLLSALSSFPTGARAAPGGIDTTQGTITLPFSIQDNTEMTLGESGLGIGVGTTTPMNLTVSGVAGIGTMTPAQTLEIRPASGGNHGGIQLDDRGDGCCAQFTMESGSSRWDTYVSAGGEYYLYQVNNGSGGSLGQWFTITSGGNVGIGQTNPSYPLDVESSNGGGWTGYFANNSGAATGGVGSNGALYAQTSIGGSTSVAVFGNATNGGIGGYFNSANNWGVVGVGGNGVYGQSNGNGGSWGGYFVGTYGVYGQSANGGWAGEFNSTNSPNGVWIGNNSNNAQLCLNGQCITSWSGNGVTSIVQDFQPGTTNIGNFAFCAAGNTTSTYVAGITPTGGSPGNYSWSVTVDAAGLQRINCLNVAQ